MPLMPQLLGSSFEALDAPLRTVHRGASGSWSGIATVRRGRNPLARLACAMAGLPPTQLNVPVVVQIEASDEEERWTRRYGTTRPMRSRLCPVRGLLVEQLGFVRTTVQLEVRQGELHWEGIGMSILGLPLPRKAFRVAARIRAAGSAYWFEVAVQLALMGELIHYEGQLDVHPA